MKFALTGLPDAFQRLFLRKDKSAETQPSQGFSLLETLTALTILAISLSALFNAYSNDLRIARTTENNTRANILAQTLIAEATSQTRFRTETRTGSNPPFTWILTTTPGPAMQQNQGQKQKPWRLITIDVSINSPDGRKLKLSTLKLGEIIE